MAHERGQPSGLQFAVEADPFAAFRDCADALASAHRELADLQAAEKEERVQSYMASGEKSVQGRDRDADIATVPLSVDIIKLKGEIKALEAELAYLTLVIEHS